ncbi:hypothetical protein Ga0123462_0764 [Mariprofundus ferrinatatus]|uniref:Uncharacterized protein n=1 Tax=Mariprofundus ferrinatatus TaxID=1921087 RepID=A0A2K8L9L7_9PROT|nr:hypothetical protein [Mariprofundus ferrinatatus]ATX81634.1 hypothetical protein Ga0123462_0764 [Mariprofundus ferrinatatus]
MDEATPFNTSEQLVDEPVGIKQPEARLRLLVVIMACVAMVVASLTIFILYSTALQEERARLVDTAQSQARLIEAVAKFDRLYASSSAFKTAYEATLSQIRDAHAQFQGFGETGEFTLATQEGDQIVFLLNHRHFDLNRPKPVPISARDAEPMRRALRGESGTIIGPDYRGETVMAAYEPVSLLNLGIVAKIDMAEIRKPFIEAATWAVLATLLLVAIGAWFFQRITEPVIHNLEVRNHELQNAIATIKTISGIVPLCAWCSKKIKDESGEWVKLTTYFDGHTDAKLSHGMCPECAKKIKDNI